MKGCISRGPADCLFGESSLRVGFGGHPKIILRIACSSQNGTVSGGSGTLPRRWSFSEPGERREPTRDLVRSDRGKAPFRTDKRCG